MFHKKISILFITFFYVTALFSQKYNFQNFSVTDGIAQSQVYALMQDTKGILWIGTRGGGISCFDGKVFKTFSTEQNLGNNYINSIIEDTSNYCVWIGTNGGLTKYVNHHFINYSFKTESKQAIIVNQVYLNQHELLLATSNGVYTFKNNTLLPLAKDFTVSIRSICVSETNAIWAATEDGVFEIKNNKAILLTDKYNITPRSITYVITDEENKLWIATYGDGVYVYENNIFYKIDEGRELAKTTVLNLFKDDDNLWISTLDKGIASYSISKKQFNWITQTEGLCNNHIRCCIKDNCGNYWIGSSGAGLSYYKGQQFVHYNLNKEPTSNLIYSVFYDSNNKLWIGNSDKGICIKNGNFFDSYNASNGFVNAKIKAIEETKHHNMLLGTDAQGLYLYANNIFKALREFKNKYIKDLFRDKKNNIWIATAGAGIYKITFTNNRESKYSVEHFNVNNHKLLSDRINCLCEDAYGNMWYGTDNNGLGYLQNGIAKQLNFKTDVVRGLTRDKYRTLWVATGNGLLNISGNNTFSAKHFSKQDGLSSNNIYSVIIDNNNNVVIGHERGIDQLKFTKHLVLKEVKHFGFQEGFVGVETIQNSVCKDNDGNIWFGTINGLTQYHITLNTSKNITPKLQLNNIRLFYLPIQNLVYDSVSNKNNFEEIKFSHNENHITFDFLGVYLNNPSKVSYQWMLGGLETNWSPLSKQESVTYPNLSPGVYTFYIRAFNEDGIGSAPFTYQFTIEAPWWKRWWFTMSWIMAVVVFIYLIYKWRINSLNRKIEEQATKTKAEKNLLELQQKTLRLQMNPHFMFNALNSIQNNIGGGNEQTARYHLAKYSKLMRMVLENSRSSLITLEDEIKMLENYLLLEKFSNNNSFDYEITVNESIEKQEILIPPMIIQPFVENAVVHGIKNLSSKGLITVSFNLITDYLMCIVEDNGVGREIKQEDVEHKSTALIVTQERLDLLQENKNYKTIEIIDLKDNFGHPIGTKIIIKIPLQLH